MRSFEAARYSRCAERHAVLTRLKLGELLLGVVPCMPQAPDHHVSKEALTYALLETVRLVLEGQDSGAEEEDKHAGTEMRLQPAAAVRTHKRIAVSLSKSSSRAVLDRCSEHTSSASEPAPPPAPAARR